MNNRSVLLSVLLALVSVFIFAQDKVKNDPAKMIPEMTEYWNPQPQVVTPGDEEATLQLPPSDAIVLFDGNNADQWQHSDGSPVKWKIENGAMTIVPKSGEIVTKRNFEDYQLHVEWSSPEKVESDSQGRGNSGIFMQGRYEVQVLDSYNNKTYCAGHAGSIYKQSPPLVNPVRKPGKWNVYDIIYTAPRFKEDGSLFTKARVTVLFNGVVVQNNTELDGSTTFIGLPKYSKHGPGPIMLQDHGNPVKFRNIWIREL